MTEKKNRVPVTGILAMSNIVDSQGDVFLEDTLQEIAEQMQKKLPLPINVDFNPQVSVGEALAVRCEDGILLIEGQLDPVFAGAGAAFSGTIDSEATEEIKDSRGNRVAKEIKKCNIMSLSVTNSPVYPSYRFRPAEPKE